MIDLSAPNAMVITSGDYFTFRGIRYGKGTEFRFNYEFRQRTEGGYNPLKLPGRKKLYFHSIVIENGKEVWRCGIAAMGDRYVNIDPDRDIYAIINPVYYFEPKELLRLRLQNGSWISYIGWQTAFYVFCLLASLVLQQWYVVWILGTYVYLRTSYITLSSP